MSTLEQKPLVLYRYDNIQDKIFFQRQFDQDFSIIFSDSDEHTEQMLKNELRICCIFLDKNDLQATLSSAIFANIIKPPRVFSVFLLGHNINIDTVPRLLKARSISKCYSKPYDANLIRSDVFAAKMNLRQTSHKYPSKSSTARNLSVLIVDDETLATKYLAKQLEQLNTSIQVLTAANADQAIAKLNDPANEVAVVISDQRMPGIQGDQLLNEVQKSFPQIIRILTSAYQEVDVALGAVNEGQIFQYLKKPWKANEIIEILKDALEEYQRISANIENNRNTLQLEHIEVIKKRSVSLRTAVNEEIKQITQMNTLDRFINFLRSLSPDTVNPSTIRASNETDLETVLISEFKNTVTLLIHDLPNPNDQDPNSKDAIIAEIIRQILSLEDSDNIEHHKDELGRDGTRIARKAVVAIDAILLSSNLARTALKASHQENTIILTNRKHSAFKIYKHLLSPLSSVPKTLIEHQSALLLLFVLSDLLEGSIELVARKKEFQISIRLDSDRYPSGAIDK